MSKSGNTRTFRRTAAAVVAAVVLTACHKDEIAVAPFERGEITTDQISMGPGPGYAFQVWYSLERSEEVATNHITDWDIAFESDPEGRGIYLNEARAMYAWHSPYETLESAADTAGYGAGKRVEAAARFFEDPAISPPPEGAAEVYLLDLGFSETGQALGLCWLEVTDRDDAGISFRSRLFGESQIRTHRAEREPARMHVRFSLRDDRVPETAPPDTEWDLVFTKYTFSFEDPPMDYLVAGVLLNPAGVRAAEVSDRNFGDITAEDAETAGLDRRKDVIGYDWKTFSFESNRFTVDSDRHFVVQGIGGLYFKLRFTDFYDDSGASGAPSFEFAVI